MDAIDPLKAAWNTPLGAFFAVLAGALLALVGVYLLVRWRLRKRDLLAAQHQDYYQRAAALFPEWQVVGCPRIDFFGRECILAQGEGEFALSKVPSPDWADAPFQERFKDFKWALQHPKVPGLRGVRWHKDYGVVAMTQTGIIDKKGRLVLTVRDLMQEGAVKPVDAESILLQLAHCLAALHDIKTAQGKLCFHGFLMPSNLYVRFSETGVLEDLSVADCGWAFALGLEGLQARLRDLRRGRLLIDDYTGRCILDQLAHLAPEVLDEGTEHLLGPEADFWSFGALACTLFTGQAFRDLGDLDWESVPSRWTAFLRACLNVDPHQRPKDFLELEEWLRDPDYALSHASNALHGVGEDAEQTRVDLAGLIDQIRQRQVRELRAEGELAPLLDSIEGHLHAYRWQAAEDCLMKAEKVDARDGDVRLFRAVLDWELGRRTEAEAIYSELEAQDSQRAQRFRQFIAFRV